MRLGGFVIHGNNRATLGGALESLAAVCDEVVAVDSCSTDGSAALVAERHVRRVEHAWRGYGAARRAAVEALAGCDWIFFLDSDEWLEKPAISVLCRWRTEEPTAPAYRVRIRDWALLPARRFVFRTERHLRLMRRERAKWTDDMIVHETVSRGSGAVRAPDALVIEHRYATTIDARIGKHELYALLWAIRAAREGRGGKPAWLQRPVHVLRDAILKGALFRGGLDGWRLAAAASRYHAQKYRYLAEIRAGLHADRVRAYDEGRFDRLFAPTTSGFVLKG